MNALKTETKQDRIITVVFRVFTIFIPILAVTGLILLLLNKFEIGSSFLNIIYIFGAEKTSLSLILLILTIILLCKDKTPLKIRIILSLVFLFTFASLFFALVSLFYSILLITMSDGFGVLLILVEFQKLNLFINYFLFFSVLGLFFVLFNLINKKNKFTVLLLPTYLGYTVYQFIVYGFTIDLESFFSWAGTSTFNYYPAIPLLFILGVSFFIQTFIRRRETSKTVEIEE